MIIQPDYARGIADFSNINVLSNKFQETAAGNIYNQIFVDIFSSFARQVSKSSFFKSNIINLIDYVPECSESHMLDIESAKSKMAAGFKKSQCTGDFNPIADGLGKEKPGQLEQAGIESILSLQVRLLIIEFILRNIFVFSEFKIEKETEIDSIIKSLLKKYIRDEIKRISEISKDSSYANQFFQNISNIDALIEEQIRIVFIKISNIFGIQGDIDLARILIEEWLPLFDVASNNAGLRLSSNTFNNLRSSANIKRSNKNYESIFNIENGNFILEKYIRIIVKTNVPELNHISAVYSISDWQQEMNKIANYAIAHPGFKLSDVYESWQYGLRLVYVPAVGNFIESTSGVPINLNNSMSSELFENVLTLSTATKIRNNALFDKSIKIFEGTNCTIDGLSKIDGQPVRLREINSIPLVAFEHKENFEDVSLFENIEGKWNAFSGNLMENLLQSIEFKFLFEYCFSLKKFLSLIMIFDFVYFSENKKLANMFNGTKMAMKTVFQTLLNAGNYKFEDNFNKQIGGNAGINSQLQNNLDTSPDVPGFSLAAMAARTPILILKGLVELIDPNISKAREIVDKAKEKNEDVSIFDASIGQFPVNIFGPLLGIGAPITPLGFSYLGLNVDEALNSAQGKKIKKENRSTDGIDLKSC